jgi:serine/threonine protein kinase
VTLDNDKARELFNAARNLPSAEREPFLDKECSEDDELRDEVEALLSHYFTSQPTAKSSNQLSDTSFEYQSGQMIGSFKILNILGEGGMGTVYRAEQKQPVRRQVAIKVIKAGVDTKQVVARFEAERQALANMNHPGISQVYEAGTTNEGRPYFAMEYVKGMAITDACDEHKLNTIQRLGLMEKVCDAVHHAHTKTIIHRDLKPDNILVYFDDDDVPQPKIIDFGVAKAVPTKRGGCLGVPSH